jgi:REP element-mobilizing transposase RayT
MQEGPTDEEKSSRLEAGATKWRPYKIWRCKMTSATRSRGYLPHLETQQAIYFVTFRLADSLPKELVLQLRKQREALKRASVAATTSSADLVRLRELRALLRKAEQCLDRGLGLCHMRDARIARIVAEAIRHFRGQRYHLLAWCVMPNHVHVLFSLLPGQRLEAVLHSWKSYSANHANALLARSGRFWQREYFDHLVRDESSIQKFKQYIRDNPRRAGLRNWPWVEVLS